MLSELGSASPLDVECRRQLGQLLRLFPYFSDDGSQFLPIVLQMIHKYCDKAQNAADTLRNWNADGPWNDAHMLGLLLVCAEKLLFMDREDIDPETYLIIQHRLPDITRKFHWNREIMAITATYCEKWKNELS